MEWGIPFNPLAARREEFHTHLTPEECRQRLQDGTASLSFKGAAASREDSPVWGRVTVRGFSITKRILGRISWQSVTSGAFVATPCGTRVVVSIHLNRIIVTVELAWAAAMLYMIVDGLITHAAIWAGLLFLSLFIPMHVVGRWDARPESEEVTQFLRTTLRNDDLLRPHRSR